MLLQGTFMTLQIQEDCLQKGAMVEVMPNQILKVTLPKGLNEQERRTCILVAIKDFLKQYTYLLVERRLAVWSKKIGVSYNQVRIKDVKTRWGSCVKETKHLNFSLKLAMLPQEVLDAVLVHELCHLKEANHGKAFWKLVYQYAPHYLEAKKWLKENHELLEFV